MKALSIMQPWASLIVGGGLAPGVKRTENRGRGVASAARRLVGNRIAVHASKRLDEDAFRAIIDHFKARRSVIADRLYQTNFFDLKPDEVPWATPREYPRGAIIGVATIGRIFDDYDVLGDHERRFFTGDHGIRLDDARWCAPIECAGALGFWTVPGTHERMLRELLGEHAA